MAETGKTVRCVVVTPEKAVLDEPATYVTVPLFDGELGVQPGRAALIGRLGAGELRLTTAAGTRRYFVEAGFVQVRADVVTVLTARAVPAAEVTADKAAAAAAEAEALPSGNAVERANKTKAQERARGMKQVAAKA
ncbi:MAG: F0F1 ATP synthase subunit epsilon [Isosphaera sp.]|nr:F0F1 ATP synthase subunit epsilon [Isosphaera sp.]